MAIQLPPGFPQSAIDQFDHLREKGLLFYFPSDGEVVEHNGFKVRRGTLSRNNILLLICTFVTFLSADQISLNSKSPPPSPASPSCPPMPPSAAATAGPLSTRTRPLSSRAPGQTMSSS